MDDRPLSPQGRALHTKHTTSQNQVNPYVCFNIESNLAPFTFPCESMLLRSNKYSNLDFALTCNPLQEGPPSDGHHSACKAVDHACMPWSLSVYVRVPRRASERVTENWGNSLLCTYLKIPLKVKHSKVESQSEGYIFETTCNLIGHKQSEMFEWGNVLLHAIWLVPYLLWNRLLIIFDQSHKSYWKPNLRTWNAHGFMFVFEFGIVFVQNSTLGDSDHSGFSRRNDPKWQKRLKTGGFDDFIAVS